MDSFSLLCINIVIMNNMSQWIKWIESDLMSPLSNFYNITLCCYMHGNDNGMFSSMVFPVAKQNKITLGLLIFDINVSPLAPYCIRVFFCNTMGCDAFMLVP